jgi:hypothetical protein
MAHINVLPFLTNATPIYLFSVAFCIIPQNFSLMSFSQIDVINGLQLLTAKPVTYLVNLSEKDYVRKKNKWRANP